jgi:hypothetical protein
MECITCINCNIKLERDADGILLCIRKYNGDTHKDYCNLCFMKMDKTDEEFEYDLENFWYGYYELKLGRILKAAERKKIKTTGRP